MELKTKFKINLVYGIITLVWLLWMNKRFYLWQINKILRTCFHMNPKYTSLFVPERDRHFLSTIHPVGNLEERLASRTYSQ